MLVRSQGGDEADRRALVVGERRNHAEVGPVLGVVDDPLIGSKVDGAALNVAQFAGRGRQRDQ